jgi:hypothetical protein
MKQAIGFGNGKIIENSPYIEKWVIIYPQLSNNFCGKIKKITDIYATLNPFYTITYFKKKGEIFPKKVLVNGDLRVPLTNSAIEPIDKKSLERFIILDNEKKRKNNSKRD